MDIATGTWFKYLRESKEKPKKPKCKTLFTEISREEHESLTTWIMNQGDINPELDDLFGGRGKMRVAFPMAGQDGRNLAQIVSALMSESWHPPRINNAGVKKFKTKEVKQKGKRRVGELPPDFGMPHPQTNPDPRPVEEYYEDKWIAELNLEKTYDFTIPAGPRKGEKIKKTDKTTMSRAIGKLAKQGKIDDELLEWWNQKQIYYTNDNKWEDVQELFDMTSTEHKYSIIVSRAPIDILRMSDIGSITSCHREGGEYFQCAREEARGHGIVAYRLYTDELNKLLGDKGPVKERAQTIVRKHILGNKNVFDVLHKHLNDADAFEFGVDANKRQWYSVNKDVKAAITYDMVREAIRAKLDDEPWPAPDINPDAELKPLSDFDDQEIFHDTDRDVTGIIANERVRMRKFYDAANHQYFVVPERVPYGAKQPGFVNVVTSWAWDNQKDLFVDDDGELSPPRPQDLTRFGGSYEDTKDGTILNYFFDEARPDETHDKFREYSATNMRQNTGTEEEGGMAALEAQLEEMQDVVEEIVQATSNRAEHVLIYGEAEIDDYGENIYINGSGEVTFTFPVGWEGNVIPRETGYYFPDEERDVKTIPKVYGGSDYQSRRAFSSILERHINFYSQDTDWNVEPALGSGFELRVHMQFNCDDCGYDVDYFDSFANELVNEIDDKYDEIYEKTRRELVDEGYLPPNDWDALFDDIKESNEELENWRGYGLDEDEYEGEVTFYFEPVGDGGRQSGVIPMGVSFPPELGNTPYALEKIFKDEGRVGGGAGFSGPGQVWPGEAFMQRLDIVLSDLVEQANGYAKSQLDFNFGDKYSRPTFEGIKFAENAQLRFRLERSAEEGKPMPVEMYLKLDIKSTESKEEIEGALTFMKYIDQFPDEIIKGIRDNFKVFMSEYAEYVEARNVKMEDGTTFWRMYERIRSKFEAQSDLGNTDAEQAILVAMWGRDNWEEMSKVEKYTLVDSYLRPLINGSLHPRNSWSAMSDLPLNWNSLVQSKMRGSEFGAPPSVWRGYSWATHHPDSDQAGLSDVQKERAKVLAWLYRNEHGPDHGGPIRPAGWSDADWKLVITEIPDLERFADEPGHEGQPGEGVGYYDRGRRAREIEQARGTIETASEIWGPDAESEEPAQQRPRNRADALAGLSEPERSAAMDALVAGDREEFTRIVQASEEEDKPGDAYKRAKEAAKARKAARGGDRPMEEQILKVDNMLNEIFDLRLYKMQIQLVVRDIEGRETDDLKNRIRGIEHCTTVRTLTKRSIGDAQRIVFELKYEQKGIIPREDFIRFELLPAIKRMPGIEIEDWSRPEPVERTLKEAMPAPPQTRPMVTPEVSLQSVAQDWMDGGVQVYDMPMNTNDMRYHVMMSVKELWRYASREFRAPKDVFDDKMNAYQEFIRDGALQPVYIALGMNGRIKITGNEDLVWFAKKAGLEQLPVFISYQKQV